MWNRREALTAALTTTLATRGQNQSRRKPNFLFLLADDHAGYALRCDGDQNAITPNLDALAAAGTRFAAHYCNSPVCTPSRQSFLTGQLPHAAGVTRLQTRLSENKPTLARQFSQAGYRTGVIGKMHFNRPGTPGLHGFDHLITESELNRAWEDRVPNPSPLPAGARTKPKWRPFVDPARIWLNAEKLPFPRIEAEMRAATQLALTEQFLESHRDQQFALWVSFLEPHSPYDFPFEDRDRISASQFKPPRVGTEDAWQIPQIFRGLSNTEKQGIAAAYYTSVAYLDRNIGKVLSMLRRLNLEESTLVVYLADHGYCLGHHGRFEKHCGYDQALRVPLIFRWPGRVRENQTVRDLSESVDVPATITDLMGLDPLPVQHGQSLRGYLNGGKPSPVRDHICSSYHENEEAFVRTARWKYIYCTGRRKRTDGYLIDNPTPGPYRRLYDLQRDPGEFTDVTKQNPKVVRDLHQVLVDRLRRTHPDAASEPKSGEPLDFYLPPRDA